MIFREYKINFVMIHKTLIRVLNYNHDFYKVIIHGSVINEGDHYMPANFR